MSRIVVKRKFLWFFNSLQKPHNWEKSGSQVIMAKNGSQPMRVQYPLTVNISLIDLYLTLVFGMFINRFLEIFCFGQIGLFQVQKWHILITLGLLYKKIKFDTMKLVNRQIKIILIVFPPKKCLFGANGPFWTQKWSILINLDWLQDFFFNFAQKMGLIVHEVILMAYLKKFLFGANGSF